MKRPALRYFGGKWRIAPWIIENLPDARIYTEVYGGGASVLLRKKRSYAEVYNDIDNEIVNYFRILRDRGGELYDLVKNTPFARGELETAYESSECDLEQARRTLIKSFMGFSPTSIFNTSGFRSNSNRLGTTPAHDWLNFSDAIPVLSERLRGVVIENRCALEVLAQHDSVETLHFVDPPYVQETRSGGKYRHDMTDDDQNDLLDVLQSLKGMVVLCGYENDLYKERLDSWTVKSRPALADGARKRTEHIWLNNAAELQTKQFSLLGGVA